MGLNSDKEFVAAWVNYVPVRGKGEIKRPNLRLPNQAKKPFGHPDHGRLRFSD